MFCANFLTCSWPPAVRCFLKRNCVLYWLFTKCYIILWFSLTRETPLQKILVFVLRWFGYFICFLICFFVYPHFWEFQPNPNCVLLLKKNVWRVLGTCFYFVIFNFCVKMGAKRHPFSNGSGDCGDTFFILEVDGKRRPLKKKLLFHCVRKIPRPPPLKYF